MTRNKKWISTALIVLGIAIAAFPIADRVYTWYWQEKLLRAFDESLALSEDVDKAAESDYLALEAIYASEPDPTRHLIPPVEGEPLSTEDGTVTPSSEGNGSPETSESNPSTTAPTTRKPVVDKSVIGKIKIAKVDVYLPLLEGATERNLNRGATHITGTSEFGEVGNAGIAAHRGRSYGLLFNRLNEVAPGDEIVITTRKKTYTYTIYEVLLVEPTDVSVLKKSKTDKVLTLVTCDPIVNPTHRLIVHALQKP